MLKARRPLDTLFTISQKGEKRDPSLYEIAQSPAFRIDRITPQEGAVDKVEFTYAGTSGVLFTDRSRSSVVIRSTVRGGSNSPGARPWVVEMKQRELEPGTGRNNTLRCRRIEFTASNVGEPIGQHEVYDFSDYSDELPPDEEFTLSHYGLPEPVGVEPKKGIPNYVWFLIGAAVFAVLAFLLRHVARRRVPAG
ncbi:MAG: hypothetical protein C0501_19275 [Isosphaera sp.]|nr:hypothetical protein [Isosphaera sp.]